MLKRKKKTVENRRHLASSGEFFPKCSLISYINPPEVFETATLQSQNLELMLPAHLLRNTGGGSDQKNIQLFCYNLSNLRHKLFEYVFNTAF